MIDRPTHWPGINGLSALLSGRRVRATGPSYFFRSNDPTPEVVEMPFMIPPDGPKQEVLTELWVRVQAVEADRAAERQRTGRRVCSRRAVLAQSWRNHPTTREPRTCDRG